VSFTPERREAGKAEYNYLVVPKGRDEGPHNVMD
jgi:hypothetical protein